MNRLYAPRRMQLQGKEAYCLHDHEFAEVLCLDEGECLHQINGHSHQLTTGDCIFIRPWDYHSFHSVNGKPFWLLNVCFQWHLNAKIAQRYYPGEPTPFGEDLPMPKAFRLEAGRLRWMRNTFFSLLQAPTTTFHIERYLMNLFAELCPLPEEDSLLNSQAPLWMKNAWQAIQHPEHLRLGPPEFHRLCGRSPEHVSREFRRLTGQTLTRSINQLRMNYASSLLASSSREIIDVALDCGFESLSHFYACFRRNSNTSPAAFRKQAQAESSTWMESPTMPLSRPEFSGQGK